MINISSDLVERENDALRANLKTDYDALGERLGRTGVDIKTITEKVAAFGVAIPSWGVGTGGTRFARFPGSGEPRDIFDKLDDCGVINRLTAATPIYSRKHRSITFVSMP
jgi:L-rhamnose isomerase/sugar isomerase